MLIRIDIVIYSKYKQIEFSHKWLTIIVFSYSVIQGQNLTDEQRLFMTDEQRLLSVLMKHYSSETRPVFNASHPVVVRLGITLTQLFDVVSRDHQILRRSDIQVILKEKKTNCRKIIHL